MAKKLALLILLMPGVAFAAPRTFGEMMDFLVMHIDAATAVLITLGLVVYFYGVIRNVIASKDKGTTTLKAYFFWGVIVLFVMVSIWGILKLMQSTLFGSSSAATGMPQQTQGFFAPAFEDD